MIFLLYSVFIIIIIILVIIITKKKIALEAVWSINVFQSNTFVKTAPSEQLLEFPTLKAADVNDVPAQFIADPFLLLHEGKYHLFFEVLDKSVNRGVIGLATSENGEEWTYERLVLKEDYHLSYPYVFNHENEFYMIPESTEVNKVLLYKAKNFPYEWEIVSELLNGRFADSSVFNYMNKWWMFAGNSGSLHLYYSDDLTGKWIEHPKSPLIKNNYNITRPAGRVIVDESGIYRYTQDGQPFYGSKVRVFKIKKLTETSYDEEEVNLVLKGTNREMDWRKDGMHHIDQIKISENNWLVVVDGHKFMTRNYLLWKLNNILKKVIM